MPSSISTAILALLCVTSGSLYAQQESLLPLEDGKAPQTIEEVWRGYDPQAEPIEAEVFREWEVDGIVLRAVRYCIGTFKGQKSWMAAIYGFPKGGTNLPAIIQIHGGGGLASADACIDNGKRGYATLSLSWRGDPRYLERYELPKAAQTDWGAVEGRQVKESRGIEPNNDKRYDPVPSARNSGYFLRTLAARRGLTFLEQQPEVDGENLGVDGHSMGGVITIQTAAIDPRVKAAAPSCAPPLVDDGSLVARTASPGAYAPKIERPMLHMSPSSDFHGRVEDVAKMIDLAPAEDFRIARSVHLNHKHDNASLAAKQLWFDSHLKQNFTYPAQPQIELDLDTSDGRPEVSVAPDTSLPIDYVDIFYTRDAKESEYATNRTRFWQYAKPVKQDGKYVAYLDLFETKEPLWVFANVHYKLENSGEEYNLTKPAESFTVTTRLAMRSAEDLQEAGIKGNGRTTNVIEPFGDDWEKEWVVSPSSIQSWLLNAEDIPVPQSAKLVIKLKSQIKTNLSVAVGNFSGSFQVAGDGSAETIEVYPFDLTEKNSEAALIDWQKVKRPLLKLSSSRGVPTLTEISWEPVTPEVMMAKRPFQLGGAQAGGVTDLSFKSADSIVGRFDLENESIKNSDRQGLQIHSHSELVYFLKGEFKTFTTTLVPGHQASVTFEIEGDGKKLIDSGHMTSKSAPEDIQVDVSGIQFLKLIVTPSDNGISGDWALWADPQLR